MARLTETDHLQEVIVDSDCAGDFDAWRAVARGFLQGHVPPEQLSWRWRNDAQRDLLALPFANTSTATSMDPPQLVPASPAPVTSAKTGARTPRGADVRVPSEFLRIAAAVACHSDRARWDALYRVLFRLTHGEPALLEVATDPDVHRLAEMNKSVRRDIHKMHAFVRFRAVTLEGAEATTRRQRDHTTHDKSASEHQTHYIAWFEPHHHIVRRATPFFTRRFISMRWSILTPAECAHWDGDTLTFTSGVSRAHAPKADELEDLWRSYYANIFNPARLAIATMQAEMPQRYWVNLPEAQLIAGLKRDAPARVMRMLQQLDEAPAEIPDDIRSRVGDALEPDRTRVGTSRGAGHAALEDDLDAPGAWDPVHDPGITCARRRAEALNREGDTSEFGALSQRERDREQNRISDCDPDRAPDNESHASCTVNLPGLLTLDDTPIRCGTASWTDPTLLRRGVFYPDDVTTAEARIAYYASHFSLVEVDATYYVPPTRAMAAAWAARSPDSFVFDVKAFALMTGHPAETKRLPDWLRRVLPRSVATNARVYATDLPTRAIDEVWERFLGALTPLRDAGKLGPILLQFPRWFTPSKANADILRVARERLGDHVAAIEFRNPEWVSGRLAARTTALLESLRLTYVVVDAPPGTASSMPPFAPVTTPNLSVVRLHGRRVETWEAKNAVVSERYRYLYDAEQLTEWSHRIVGITQQLDQTSFPDMAKAKQGVHVVFNNCHANYGTSNATEITRTLIEFDKIRRRLI